MRTHLLTFLLFLTAVPLSSAADPPAGEGDEVFDVSHSGGVILPLEQLSRTDGLDPGVFTRYEQALDSMRRRRFAEAKETFAGLVRDLPATEVYYGAAVASFEMEQFRDAEVFLKGALSGQSADVRANNLMGLTLSAQGRGRESLPFFDACLATARKSGNVPFEAYALLNAAIAVLEGGDAEGAASRAEQALHIGESAGYGNVRAAALNTLGNSALHRGERGRAEELYRASLKLERKNKGAGDRAVVLSNLAHLHAGSGRGQEALEWFNQALTEVRSQGNRVVEASVLVGMAQVEVDLSRMEESRKHLAEAEALYDALKLPRGGVEVRLEKARQALTRNDADGATSEVSMARQMLQGLDLPVEKADARLLSATALAMKKDARAEGEAREAEKEYSAAGQPEGVARAKGLQGDLVRARGDLKEGARLYREALAVFSRTGLTTAEADLRGRLALLLLSSGETGEGIREGALALSSMARGGRLRAQASLEDEMGIALDQTGKSADALEHFLAASAVAQKGGAQDLLPGIAGHHARALARLGRIDEAMPLAETSGDSALLAEIRLARVNDAYAKGVAAVQQGRHSAALAAFQQAQDGAPPGDAGEEARQASRAGLSTARRMAARVASEKGDRATAAQILELAVKDARASGMAKEIAASLWDLGRLMAEDGESQAAAGFLTEALKSAQDAGDIKMQAGILLQRGATFSKAGSLPEAMADFLVVKEKAGSLPDGTRLQAQAGFNLGVLQIRSGEAVSGRETLEKARGLFQKMGDSSGTRQVEDLLARLASADTAEAGP